MFLWPASRICQDWTLSKWGKARPRTPIEYPGMHETGLENENITPLLFKKKNSKMRGDCFRNLGRGVWVVQSVEHPTLGFRLGS